MFANFCGRDSFVTIAKPSTNSTYLQNIFRFCGCGLAVVIELIHIYHHTQPEATTRKIFGERFSVENTLNQTDRFEPGLLRWFTPTKSRQRTLNNFSSFPPIFILIVAAEGEVTSPSSAPIRMKFKAKLEALDDIRCLQASLYVGVKRPGSKRSVC